MQCRLFQPDDGGTTLLWNVGNYLPVYNAYTSQKAWIIITTVVRNWHLTTMNPSHAIPFPKSTDAFRTISVLHYSYSLNRGMIYRAAVSVATVHFPVELLLWPAHERSRFHVSTTVLRRFRVQRDVTLSLSVFPDVSKENTAFIFKVWWVQEDWLP